MIKFSRRTVAAATTTALCGIGAVAFAAGSQRTDPVGATAATPAAAPEVRTVVVHRTVKRVRHVPAKSPAAQTSSAPPEPATTPAPAPAPATPATQRAERIASQAPDRAASEPLRTATSGGGEYGDDQEYGEDREDHGDDAEEYDTEDFEGGDD